MTRFEGLWMINIQKICVFASRIIYLGMVKGIVMELKGIR
jgi:hypothetical protein